MITKFETGAAAPGTGTGTGAEAGKGGNALVWIVVIAAAAYLGYKFVYLPYVEKQKQNDKQPS